MIWTQNYIAPLMAKQQASPGHTIGYGAVDHVSPDQGSQPQNQNQSACVSSMLPPN